MTNCDADRQIAELAIDPLKFISLCWPEMKLYDKQAEILLSIRDNIGTFVHAANELGKSRIAAIAVIWWFVSWTPARVITSSSSQTQLESILWSEIRSLIETSAYRLPFRSTSLKVEKLKSPHSQETEPRDYIIGHVTNEVENFQGHHLPNDKPRVLCVFDEASAIPDAFYDAASSWAHRILVIGNPLSNLNFFYRQCREGDLPDPAGTASLLRKVIHVSGLDSPNVRAGIRWKENGNAGPAPLLIPGLLTHDEYLRRDATWDEVKKTTRLLGNFYEGNEAFLFPTHWLDSAMHRDRWQETQRRQRTVEAIGVDVAAGGRDDTVWTLIDRTGVIDQIVMDTPNTTEITGRTVRLIEEHNLAASRVAIDSGGGGKQISDRLHELAYYVRAIGFGEAADDSQAYKNRRAELYGNLRRILDPERENGSFLLPPLASELRQEIAVLPLQFDSEGRMYLPPKERRPNQAVHQTSIRELLGRSPDRADSLVLAAWALRLPSAQFTDPLICSGDDDECGPITAEELAEWPADLREIVEGSRDSAEERESWAEDWRDRFN